ncbi:anaerobic ribonucleoside triphosphate reductase [Amantichitinum ursilacus]|uniref:Anaerobic ribonucleoside triphosphate reductase n=1 Tax=Amantichitinum ursilacus TaxID=857265 RepID=A0A0N0GN57_9NEIS|nr:anaerobic ribonucleoside triphosphate reductase [Amantichitinum ursilacus]
MNAPIRPEMLQQQATQLDPSLRTRCEIWTRVMGYHRPVSAFNIGKQAEFAERQFFKQ